MTVEYSLEGDIALITLNRPGRYNAIDPSLSEGLQTALARAGTEARAVVLTGAGKAFCSGADLNDLLPSYQTGDGPDLASLLEDVFHPAIRALLDSPVPVLAAINGVTAGAGVGLAFACDLRIMAEGSYLTSAFTAIGLAPDSGTTWWLPHAVGVPLAIELALTNRRLGAEEAKERGVCMEVVPADQLAGRSLQIAATLADLVPDALVTTRLLIREAAGSSLQTALHAEQAAQDRLGHTAEHAEGVKAFIEKRKPDFRKA
jgi:2-(1,2-epoxy-1,2-dihydrophenyl)acetyl-CoA isomerase